MNDTRNYSGVWKVFYTIIQSTEWKDSKIIVPLRILSSWLVLTVLSFTIPETGVKTVFRNKKSTSWESWSDISPVGETKNFYPEIQPPRYGCQIIKFKVIKILIHKNI